jgi:uncharacterized protein (DUF1499 family)
VNQEAIITPWTGRLARGAAFTGIGGALLAIVGSYGSGFGLWPFEIGFLFIGLAILCAVVALLIGTIALAKGARGASLLIGMVCALIFAGIMAYWVNRGVSNPPIHDISTDLINPPTLTKLSLRPDNLIGVTTIENWRAVHAQSFPDIAPITLAKPPSEAIKVVEALVRERGWAVALVVPDRIEATETASPFQFKDDVVVTVTLAPDGASSIVNMRSVSRVGLSDLGVNAARVRAFLADLKG